MGRQESIFLGLRRQIELSWVDNLVLRINMPFLSKQSLSIMNKNSKKIRMNKFRSLFFNVKKKTFQKRKNKKKKTESKNSIARKRMLLNTSKYGSSKKSKVKRVGR
jgi:hypothetical protein